MVDIVIKLKHENSKDISTIYEFSENKVFIKEKDKLYNWYNIPHVAAILDIHEKVENEQYEFYDKESELLYCRLIKVGIIHYNI